MILKDVSMPIVYVITRTASNIEPVIFALREYGFITEIINSFAELMEITSKNVASLILIDGGDISVDEAEEYCQIIKKNSGANKMLFVMLQSGNVLAEQKGFNPNADLNLMLSMKQDVSEIVSEIRAVFLGHQKNYNPNILVYDDVVMNLASYRVNRGNKVIKLGPTEFKILQCLMQYPHKILSRTFIIKAVWGDNTQVEPRTIDVHINRLRNSLKLTADELPMIETIRSSGYCLRKF